MPSGLHSFKQGATGTEDFASPEYNFESQGHKLREQGNTETALRADRAWEANRSKHNEICLCMQDSAWGYNAEAEHFEPDYIRGFLAYALNNNCNLLCNTGPLPDGSIHSHDAKTLKECGNQIRKNGWPTAEEIHVPDRGLKKKSAGEGGGERKDKNVGALAE